MVTMKKGCIDLLDTFRMKGLKGIEQAILNVLADWLHDIRYGINTKGVISLNDLKITSENKSRGVHYRPTRARPLKRLLKHLEFPRSSVFVDFGCGKGRTLLIAAEYDFQKLVGVEFSSELCKEAKKNISIYREINGADVDIEIIESDACNYEIKDDENVFYLFHPFDDVVMSRVLDNLEVSIKKKKRKIWLIYNYPVYRSVIEKRGYFLKLREYIIGNTEIVVYLRNP